MYRIITGVRELPSGTVTFLFTDIEGSTRLLQELGDRYADALAEHRRVLRRSFVAHRGVEVDTQGDAFFVAFARASDGVTAARSAQDMLASGPIRVRMGLHTGEPILTEGLCRPRRAQGRAHRRLQPRWPGAAFGGDSSTHRRRGPRPWTPPAQGPARARANLPARGGRVPATQEPQPDQPARAADTVPRPRARTRRGAQPAPARGRAPADTHGCGRHREDASGSAGCGRARRCVSRRRVVRRPCRCDGSGTAPANHRTDARGSRGGRRDYRARTRTASAIEANGPPAGQCGAVASRGRSSARQALRRMP